MSYMYSAEAGEHANIGRSELRYLSGVIHRVAIVCLRRRLEGSKCRQSKSSFEVLKGKSGDVGRETALISKRGDYSYFDIKIQVFYDVINKRRFIGLDR